MPGVPRAERVRQVLALKERGLNNREIALELGITESTARNVLNDPDGSKQKERRKRYQGVCIDCEGPTHGSSGRDGKQVAMRCKWCAQGLQPPFAARPRLRVPVRLDEIPLDVRLEGVRYASYREKDSIVRQAILLAAVMPSSRTYWVSESAIPLIESWATVQVAA